MRVRILLADDHQVVRTGLRALLESKAGWQVCAEAANGREAVEKAGQLKPDVAVLDIGMPLLNGVEATRQIRKLSPQTEVLILTMHDSEVLVQEVLEAGAHGYILKDDADRNLIAAVDALRRHKPYLSPRVSEAASGAVGSDGSSFGRSSRGRLTPRERERSEEHTSELQSLTNLVCRLLLEKKKHILASLHSQHHKTTLGR